MLRISKMADYATVLMVYLARRHRQGLSNAREIAERIHVGVPTVSKLLKLLAHADLLQSARGVNGGYQLVKPPRDISVADIIVAVDGAAGLTECSISDGLCSLQSVCRIQGNWQLLSRAIEEALRSVNLEEFARETMSSDKIDVSEIEQLGVSDD